MLILPQENLLLFDLGYAYEDFRKSLARQRNEVLLKDMLMEESVRSTGAESDYSVTDENGQQQDKGRCELRLYETALVLLPENSGPLRIPYADITHISGDDYSVTLGRDTGEKIVLSAMGGRFAGFRKDLSDAMNELSLNIQSLLKRMLPDVPSHIIRKLSAVMRDGRAVRRMEVDAISPEIWYLLLKGSRRQRRTLLPQPTR